MASSLQYPTSARTPSYYPSPQSSSRPGPSFPVQYQKSSSSATTSALTGAVSIPLPIKALSHKHAHHLHSIPPREKSTRTLILDHMLWIHARARLQQARAELGMNLRQNNISAAGGHRMDVDRDMDEQDGASDGEDVLVLKFGAKERQRDMRFPIEEEYLGFQYLNTAHSLRLHADGVEKVLTAMLDQPPELQPPYSDEDTPRAPHTFQGIEEYHCPNGVRLRLALSTLINDLFARDMPTPLSPTSSNTSQAVSRIRPAVTPSTSPVLSSMPKQTPTSMLFSSSGDVWKGKEYESETLPNGLPTALAPLALISSHTNRDDNAIAAASIPSEGGGTALPSISSVTRGSTTSTTDTLPPILPHSSFTDTPMHQTSSALNSPNSGEQSFSSAPPTPATQRTRPSKATGRVLLLYRAGADPSTANSPPSLRCPRHLHHSCVICAPVKNAPLPPGSAPPQQPGASSSSSSPRTARAALVLGANGKSKMASIGVTPPAAGLATWKVGAGIGAGLAQPGIRGTALRRRTVSYLATSHPTPKGAGPCASGCKLADLIPRFVRLSALVAIELGKEAKEREDEDSSVDGMVIEMAQSSTYEITMTEGNPSAKGKNKEKNKPGSGVTIEILNVPSALPSSSPGRASVGAPPEVPTPANAPGATHSTTPVTISPYALSIAYRPTREWYAILSGLLTRAVLEGYLSRGWKGPQGMECLMGVGLGLGLASGFQVFQQPMQAVPGGTDGTEGHDTDDYSHLDPDDLPPLFDAALVVFPALRGYVRAAAMGLDGSQFQGQYKEREGAEADFEIEMMERLSEFLTVPPSTPDLSTHLEDLAYKFAAEPVERSAVRFCEAVSTWRGMPELENYKKKSKLATQKQTLTDTRSNSASATPDILAQSSIQNLDSFKPQKPPIEMYFVPPPLPPPTAWPTEKRGRTRKKRRQSPGAEESAAKRANRETSPTGGSGSRGTPASDGSAEATDSRSRDDSEWIGPYGV